MTPIAFASSNAHKFSLAQHVCSAAGLEIQQVFLDIDEIQGEDSEIILRHKAKSAYEQYQNPIIVSDDSWSIPALNGFPGAYMKSLNYWFKPEDFLRLMHGIEDRRIFINQYLAYTDGHQTTVFRHDIPGVVLEKEQGHMEHIPIQSVVMLDSDNGKSIAEIFAAGKEGVAERYKTRRDAWHAFVEWYKAQ